MKHVFISYKRDDRSFASELESKLIDAGFDTWTDNVLRAGENWRDGIDEAIHDSFALIVLLTTQSRKSEYVTYEWSFAMGLGIPIIPVMLSQTKFHPKLEPLHYIDFTKRFAEPWDVLIERVKQIKENTQTHSVPLPRTASPAIKNAVVMLDHPDSENIGKAIVTLQNMYARDDVALEALLQATKHANSVVRAFSVLALGEIKAKAALNRLTEMLVDEVDTQVPPLIRKALGTSGDLVLLILTAIENIGPQRICKELAQSLQFISDEAVRSRILRLLEVYGDEQIANELLETILAGENSHHKAQITDSIIKLAGQSTANYARDMISTLDSRYSRRNLLTVIGKFGQGQTILNTLMQWLSTADELFDAENVRLTVSSKIPGSPDNPIYYHASSGKGLLVSAIVAICARSTIPVPQTLLDLIISEKEISEHIEVCDFLSKELYDNLVGKLPIAKLIPYYRRRYFDDSLDFDDTSNT